MSDVADVENSQPDLSLVSAELRQVIDDYRVGLLPLLAPLTLIKHYLSAHPDEYLSGQTYLEPYPQELRLRYGL